MLSWEDFYAAWRATGTIVYSFIMYLLYSLRFFVEIVAVDFPIYVVNYS